MTEDTDFFFTSIAVIYRKFQMFINNELNCFELHSSEIPFLITLLFYHDGMLQDDLSKKTKLDKAATSRALRSLEEKNFIYRKESPHSNRHKQVFLQPKALKIKDDIEATLHKWKTTIFEDYTEEEINTICSALKKMAFAASRI